MEIFIGAIITIIAIIIYTQINKRKRFKEIDDLDQFKKELINRPVLDELSKVKSLNLTGEAEEWFEKWRQEWDEIITVHFPDIEEWFFEAEDAAEKYKFKKSQERTVFIAEQLEVIEERINTILKELAYLIESHETNEEKVKGALEVIHSLHVKLINEKTSFGRAARALEKEYENLLNIIRQYEELTGNGDYLKANSVVTELLEHVTVLEKKLTQIPSYLNDFSNPITADILDATEGFAEMKKMGYNLNHLKLEEELKALENLQATILQDLYQGSIAVASEKGEELTNRIESIFDHYQVEVEARTNTKELEPKVKDLLDTVTILHEEAMEQVEEVKRSYELAKEEKDAPTNFYSTFNKLKKRYEGLADGLAQSNVIYSSTHEALIEIENELTQLELHYKEYIAHLKTLRKDELLSKEIIAKTKLQLMDIAQRLLKSNTPGVPASFQAYLEETTNHVQHTFDLLKQNPLNMKLINESVEEASSRVKELDERVEELMDQCRLAEQVIQYGNRYRNRYEVVKIGLTQAEKSFRSYQYQQALEEAATALEEVEPGALQKIEKLLNEDE
ncbi:septation ring formation regulator EzrA [Mangrovibacillus cuniculi]|uniref:Septation ring formation regulator EzrA n=1 Tax=Mangrovibacillus cuniculi TaxID=2593652 RepID=A0A7S8HG61_9BACI|nr:septation ring formation regulator EzrA [Mangrovibacillus cuniculi]QPC47241.1 hypothetical protein G8O30_09785 [Mangrovibacillus cuniculi]